MDVGLLLLGSTHFVGDFLQNDWMARFKAMDLIVEDPVTGKKTCVHRWYTVLMWHVGLYTSVMILGYLCSGNGDRLTPQGIVADAVTHYLTDVLKGRLKLVTMIWIDQLIHLTTRAVLWHLGWL
jgi:hypothetical protein